MKFRRVREATPGAARQARETSVQAEQMAMAQRAAALARVARAWEVAKAGGPAQVDPDFEPIAGVGLEQFAAVNRGIAAFGHDQSKLAHVIVSAGIPFHHWETAARGWQDGSRATMWWHCVSSSSTGRRGHERLDERTGSSGAARGRRGS